MKTTNTSTLMKFIFWHRKSVTTKVFYILLFYAIFLLTCRALECTDDKFYVYNGKKNKTCQWVAQNIDDRCGQVDIDYVEVRDRCRLTCNNCLSTTKTLRDTGQWCTEGSQCLSGVCQQNTCYASEQCRPLKQPWGGTFDRNKIIIVFVGSGFTDHMKWQQQVHKIFETFKKFEMFEYTNLRFNVFYVDILQEGFCEYGCRGVDTLLCCKNDIAKSLSSNCFPSQATLQTVVVHNDSKYGGAGYRDSNIATTTTHRESGYVAVHELGHSLFELGDEYKNSVFNAKNSANCDVAGCPKWSDLGDHLGVKLCKSQSCQGGGYYVAIDSFMNDLKKPFGEVNLRFTCCTYLALTKGLPSYCNRFDFGEGLVNYCKKDYQGYGGTAAYQELYAAEKNGLEYKSEYKSKYLYVARPVVILFNVDKKKFTYAEEQNRYGMRPSIHRRHQMLGDYYDILSAFDARVSVVWKITAEFNSGQTQEMLFNPLLHINPPIEDELVKLALGNATDFVMELVVDGSKGLVDHVKFEIIRITWWVVLKAWLSRLWSNIFVFFKSSE